jgi:hypothetical protein
MDSKGCQENWSISEAACGSTDGVAVSSDSLTMALTANLAAWPPPFLPAVVKPDIGAFVRDCVKIDSIEDWGSTLENCNWRTRPRIVQEYVRPAAGVDYRVTVLFGEVVFVYQRSLVDGWIGKRQLSHRRWTAFPERRSTLPCDQAR